MPDATAAVNGRHLTDAEKVTGWLRALIGPGQVAELRALKVKRRGEYPHTEAGFFDADHLEDMARAALAVTAHARGTYYTLNPLRTDALARRSNRLDRAEEGELAKDGDVVGRSWLLIDCDPERDRHVSASADEKAAAHAKAQEVWRFLQWRGWPQPAVGDSGNGYHLLYRVDLPADDGGLVQRVLQALARRFDSAEVKIDQAVFNPSRICKVPGTWARKGDDTADRPHRQAALLVLPGDGVVAHEQLERLVEDLAPEPEAKAAPSANGHANGHAGGNHRLDVGRWLSARGVGYRTKAGESKGRTVYVLDGCPFDQAHGKDSCVMQAADGGLSAKCLHNGCSGRGWKEFRDKIGGPDDDHYDPPIRRRAECRGEGDKVLQGDRPHLSDAGNARRLIERHGEDLRFCHPAKTWYCWDAKRWAEDQSGEAVRRVKDTQRAYYLDVLARLKAAPSKAAKAALLEELDWALKWESATLTRACLELARCEVPVLPADLDRGDYLLNVKNGTLDLRTGELRPHRREDLITKLAPVEYDPGRGCPEWLMFLERVMGGNVGLIDYLQRVVGYALTGDVSEQCLWFFYGKGANGKSTFLGAVKDLLGDYGCQAVSELLMARNSEAHPTERADLAGRRFVATIETDQGKRMAEALMKQLTGGDTLKARKMRQDFVELRPTWKVFLAANHKPTVRGTDLAAWRRIKLVPWTVTIPDAEKDRHLPAKLRAEWPGILRWAVEGCLEWQRRGLDEPDEVRQATAAYQAEQDTLGAFLAECCFVHREAKVKASELLEAYCRFSGEKDLKSPTFNARMADKGFESKRVTAGYFYLGVALNGGDYEHP
jgi:P4 family phage/plasmid primase-like protien